MTTLGLIGAGNIGGTIARLAVAAGHDVVLSNSRGPETLADLVRELGSRARAATAQDAAAVGDLVVVTIPLKNYRAVPVESLRGKVVIDTNNYYPQRDGQIAELDDESTTTSELLQAHLPGSHVVKGFNNIYFGHLAILGRPAGDPQRSVITIAGDDAAAKRTVAEFLDSIGYDAFDAGPLAEGWRFQRDTAAYAGLYIVPGTEFPGPGRPATPEFVQQKLAEAKRYLFGGSGGSYEVQGAAENTVGSGTVSCPSCSAPELHPGCHDRPAAPTARAEAARCLVPGLRRHRHRRERTRTPSLTTRSERRSRRRPTRGSRRAVGGTPPG